MPLIIHISLAVNGTTGNTITHHHGKCYLRKDMETNHLRAQQHQMLFIGLSVSYPPILPSQLLGLQPRHFVPAEVPLCLQPQNPAADSHSAWIAVFATLKSLLTGQEAEKTNTWNVPVWKHNTESNLPCQICPKSRKFSFETVIYMQRGLMIQWYRVGESANYY